MKRRWISFVLSAVLLLTLLPTSAVAADKKLVAFTFDDGPSPYTASLLDGLRERGAYATFFMAGTNGSTSGITNQKQVLSRMWKEGHQLANHTFSHNIKLSNQTDAVIRQEVTSVEDLLFQTSGQRFQDMVRTPGGATGGNLLRVIPAPVILWSVDTLDWKYRNADTVYNNIISNVKDGSIVLLHDLYRTSIEGALRAIDTLQKQGYECVTVAELMRRRGVTPVNGTVYRRVSATGADLPAYEAPTVTIVEDPENALQFTVSSRDSGLSFYYTTDGSMPTMASTKYTGPVSLKQDITLTVCGVDAYGTRTPLTTKTIHAAAAAAPEISLENGKMVLTSATPGAEIYVTMDGSIPSAANGIRYTGPFFPGNVVRAVAVKSPLYHSPVVTLYRTAYGDFFMDVQPQNWYFGATGEIVRQKLMNGTAPYRFDPDEPLTKASAATILYRLAGSPAVEVSQSIADAAPTAWYAEAVTWITEKCIADVDRTDSFYPSEIMDRQAFALMLYRFALSQGRADSGAEIPSVYADRSDVSDLAAPAFAWCIREGIINGTSPTTLSPLTKLTRAQCAAMLLRFETAIGM